MPRSFFISLDGLDGTGKSTQCRLLADWLRARGHEVTECRDPGGTELGGMIRDLLLDRRQDMSVACETFLFMASRTQLVREIIRPALAADRVVVCDRYLLANVVYQGHAGGLDPALLWQMGSLATEGLLPDLTILLDAPLEVALSRLKGPADRMESRDAAYQGRVREGFLLEARRAPERIKIINAAQAPEAVHARICEEVARVLATGSRT
jgi:dTMP kinase